MATVLGFTLETSSGQSARLTGVVTAALQRSGSVTSAPDRGQSALDAVTERALGRNRFGRSLDSDGLRVYSNARSRAPEREQPFDCAIALGWGARD
jgi:hypothetical protein